MIAIPKSRLRAWIIWGLAAGFFLVEYFARVSTSVMIPQLIQDLKVSADQLGLVSACFYYAYIAMQLPVGSLVDRFGPRRLLSVSAIVCGIGCAGFAMSTMPMAAAGARLLMGASAAFAFVGALKIANTWFPKSKFALLAGCTQALGMAGAAIGEGPVASIVQHSGWRHTMFLMAIILAILGVLIYLIARDQNPKTKLNYADKNSVDIPEKKMSLRQSFTIILGNKQTWINAIYIGFVFAPTAAFAELWGAHYLHQVHHLPPVTAASAISMVFIGWAIGSPIAGAISDRIKRRKPILILSALFSLIFLSSALFIPNLTTNMIFVLLFMYGFSNVGVAISYAVAAEINPSQVSGTAMAFTNMASVLIGSILQPVIGMLLEYFNHAGASTTNMHNVTAFYYAAAPLPVCLLISLVAALFLRESYKGTVAN